MYETKKFFVWDHSPHLEVDEVRPLPTGTILELANRQEIVRAYFPKEEKSEKQNINTQPPLSNNGENIMIESISELFDGVFSGWADTAGLSPEDVSSAIAPEIAALGIELPVDFFTTKLGGKVIYFLLGTGMLTAGTLALQGNRRGKIDMLRMGAHFLGNVADPTLEDIQALISGCIDVKNTIAQNNMKPEELLRLFIKTQSDVDAQVSTISSMVDELVSGKQIQDSFVEDIAPPEVIIIPNDFPEATAMGDIDIMIPEDESGEYLDTGV